MASENGQDPQQPRQDVDQDGNELVRRGPVPMDFSFAIGRDTEGRRYAILRIHFANGETEAWFPPDAGAIVGANLIRASKATAAGAIETAPGQIWTP